MHPNNVMARPDYPVILGPDYPVILGLDYPVILGLDPRISPFRHIARFLNALACREILGSSPRMTAKGERLPPWRLTLRPIRLDRAVTMASNDGPVEPGHDVKGV